MTPDVQHAFKALADPTRRQILQNLMQGEMTIAEVSDGFEMTRAAVKKHLSILEKGKLISVHSQGRERINKLEPMGLQTVTEWLSYFDQFWDERLNALSQAIENDIKKGK